MTKFRLHSQNQEQLLILNFQRAAHSERLPHCLTKKVAVAAIKYFILKWEWEKQNLLYL